MDSGAKAITRGPRVARAALWVLVFVTLLSGAILLAGGGYDVWTLEGNTYTFVERVDTRAFGAALVCVGVVVLAATLICELDLPARARLVIPDSARISLRLHDEPKSPDVPE
jgi:TRAP-type C4-dicarboxylate transport system permease small subunit